MWKYITLISALVCGYFFISVSSADDQANLPLTPKCLGCICEAISQCNLTRKCEGNICGPFAITWGYWADANKPTIAQEPVNSNSYASCANDHNCSVSAVQHYMSKFYQDCNGDGVVDCDDFVAIHMLGGYGCDEPLPDYYVLRYQQCKKHGL